jgi:hypothetical protein
MVANGVDTMGHSRVSLSHQANKLELTLRGKSKEMKVKLTFSNGDCKTISSEKVAFYLLANEDCNQELQTPITLSKIEAINNCEKCGYEGNLVFCPVCINADIEQMIKYQISRVEG